MASPLPSVFFHPGSDVDFDLLAHIAASAQTLDERLKPAGRGGSRSAGSAADEIPGIEILDVWRRLVSGGDRKAFEKRLAWDGWDAAYAAAALAAPAAFPARVLPVWTETLRRISEASRNAASRRGDSGAGDGVAIDAQTLRGDGLAAFPELWVGAVDVARERLHAAAGAEVDRISASAMRSLESQLLGQAASVAGPAVAGRWMAHARESAWPSPPESAGAVGQEARRRFVASLLSGGLEEIFAAYPVLARQICVLAETWADGIAVLLARLAADADLLASRFGARGRVANIRANLSDRHAGGRTVAILEFDAGASVVYKPRSVAVESAWNDGLRWANANGAPVPFAAIDVCDRGAYGWAELARPAGRTPETVREYVRASGALLCAAWLFGLDDLHVENVIATERGPVVVDAESALQPVLASEGKDRSTAIGRVADDGRRSALRTGLLATARVDERGCPREIGGFRGGTGGANLPILRDGFGVRSVLPDDDPDAFLSGFTETYRFLADRSGAGAFSAADGPLEAFAAARTRLVIRPSDVYARLLLALSAPAYLADGRVYGFGLDSINREFRDDPEPPALWPLTREERVSLSSLDVPYFSIGISSREIDCRDGERIGRRIARSGLEAARGRLAAMDEDDLAFHKRVLAARLPPPGRGRTRLSAAGFSDGELTALAAEIGDEVIARAVVPSGSGGGIVWADPDREAVADPSLYSGGAGIALFCAALGRVTGEERFREAARRAGAAIAAELARRDDGAWTRRASLGAGGGLGSIVYAFAVAGALLSDDSLFAVARAAGERITPSRILEETLSDVEGGAAGAILGLLELARATDDDAALARAIACGERVLAARIEPAPGLAGWPAEGKGGSCLAGFAHGAGGISLALTRLSRAAQGREDFRAVADAARQYEETLYDPDRGNWPILRGERPFAFMTAWCHGAPGIALARAGILAEQGDDAGLSAELERAVESARKTRFLETDHLCCGNAGIADALIACGEIAGRPEWIEEGRSRLAGLLQRAAASGAFRLGAAADRAEAPADPGFFRGLSGIGYSLLRGSGDSHGAIPCVLVYGHGDFPE